MESRRWRERSRGFGRAPRLVTINLPTIFDAPSLGLLLASALLHSGSSSADDEAPSAGRFDDTIELIGRTAFQLDSFNHHAVLEPEAFRRWPRCFS
jgi:hypothetical protein